MTWVIFLLYWIKTFQAHLLYTQAKVQNVCWCLKRPFKTHAWIQTIFPDWIHPVFKACILVHIDNSMQTTWIYRGWASTMLWQHDVCMFLCKKGEMPWHWNCEAQLWVVLCIHGFYILRFTLAACLCTL